MTENPNHLHGKRYTLAADRLSSTTAIKSDRFHRWCVETRTHHQSFLPAGQPRKALRASSRQSGTSWTGLSFALVESYAASDVFASSPPHSTAPKHCGSADSHMRSVGYVLLNG